MSILDWIEMLALIVIAVVVVLAAAGAAIAAWAFRETPNQEGSP